MNKKRRDTPAPLTMPHLGGVVNMGYSADDLGSRRISTIEMAMMTEKPHRQSEPEKTVPERPQWSSGLEYLMSLIAMSVGLGNIWRFPFTAYENGGGAFLIPYIIVLAVIGRPLYLMEMALGQFSSSGAVQIWSIAPIFTGVGYGQVIAQACVLTYYVAIMGITLHYMVASFQPQLPWAACRPAWDNCFDSYANVTNVTVRNTTGLRSSSELYFLNDVLHEQKDIDSGIGLPDWQLSLYLLLAWAIIFMVLIRGVQSSGKAAYFLALFPYVVLIALLVRGVTLPGAWNGILFFITPQWDKLLDPKVWHAAVTQAFYSLGVCFGALLSYSSYSQFKHNIYRDAMIVTVLDTVTSLIAGFTIFGILGNLAFESGTTDISQVTKGGAGLAFISYPDAIAKFDYLPQVFSVLFFFMLFVLGIGTAVSGAGAVVTIFLDQFPTWPYWRVALATSVGGYLCGLVYVTPGGQYILNLVDYFAGSFGIFILASLETIAIFWIYGLENFCDDVEFMLDRRMGAYWRICWGLVTPILLMAIFIYSVAIAAPLTYGGYIYPQSAYVCGYLLMALGIAQLPIWAIVVICKRRRSSLWQAIKGACTASDEWGPSDAHNRKLWQQLKRDKADKRQNDSISRRMLSNLFNLET